MDYVVVRLPRVIEYEPGSYKQLQGYDEFLTDRGSFQADGFDLEPDDFDEPGLRDEDSNRVSIIPARFSDRYSSIDRGPQIMAYEDIGYIASRTGVTRASTILEAGAGSGAATAYLGSIARSVDAYDIDEDNVSLVEKNLEALGVEQASVSQGDIYDPTTPSHDEYDLVVIDVPSPWKAVSTVQNALCLGGHAAFYTPQVDHAKRVVASTAEAMHHVETVSVERRQWRVNDRQLRPATKQVTHTGFITVLRRID